MKKNIILVGFMGTGKSSVGRRLAERLQMDFFDTDQEMEAVTGLDLLVLYRKYGKIRFQSEENLVLCKMLQKENSVIATGGTLELYPERLQAMRSSGMLVCLKADIEIIERRVARKDNRPLLRKKYMTEDIRRLYTNQICWEQVANLVIDTSEKSFEQILRTICIQWEREKSGFL